MFVFNSKKMYTNFKAKAAIFETIQKAYKIDVLSLPAQLLKDLFLIRIRMRMFLYPSNYFCRWSIVATFIDLMIHTNAL